MSNNYKDALIAHVKTVKEYEDLYDSSLLNADTFWGKIADRISWEKKWDEVSDVDYNQAKIRWYEGGQLNASYNCLDRHVEKGLGNKTALIWEGNNPNEDKKYSYSKLLEEVCKFSNG